MIADGAVTTMAVLITEPGTLKNFAVVTAPISDPSEKNWKPFIDHNPKVKIDGLTTFAVTWLCRKRKAGWITCG